jgi:predicted NBD/HSP70 family sugar kinase
MSNGGSFVFDIGGTWIRAGLKYSLVPDLVVETPPDGRLFVCAIRSLLQRMSEVYGQPESILIACPGIIVDGYLEKALYLPVEKVSLVDVLGISPKLMRLTIVNDADALALGDPGYGRITYFVLAAGTAVGGALVIDGKLIGDSNRSVSEIGHVPVGKPELTCECGGQGCLDTALAGRQLEARLGREWWTRRSDPHIQAALSDAGIALSRATRTVACLYDVSYVHLIGHLFSLNELWAAYSRDQCGLGAGIALLHSVDSWRIMARADAKGL